VRDAQCGGALLKLRNQLHTKSRLLTYKKNHARHQGANTRSRTLVARNESKIRLHSEKYQAAWNGIRLLNGGDVSRVGWRQLRKEDIHTMEDPEELSRGEARRRKQAERRKRKLQQLQQEGEILMDDDSDPEMEEYDDDVDVFSNTAENRREVLWIWTVAGAAGTDAELEEALRIEWAKAWA
jgi:hypothetical protein